MEEKQFFEEMKPLLKDYVEFTKEDMSEKWENMEKEALAKVEEIQARLDEAKNKEMEARRNTKALKEAKHNLKKVVPIIGDKEYKSIEGKENECVKKIEEYAREYNKRKTELAQAKEEVEQTKNGIEQEKQERIDKQQGKQENIYAKAKDYIESTKEKMKQEVEEKSKQLEEMRAKRRELALEAKNASELRLTIKRSSENVKKSETYKVLSEKADEELQKRKAMYKEYNQEMNRAKEELEGAETQLASFEEKYDVIDFASEAGIQSLIEITGGEEQREESPTSTNDLKKDEEMEGIHRLKEDEVEIVKETQDIKKEGQPKEEGHNKTQQQKWNEIKTIFKKIEDGFEDVLPKAYLEEKYKTLGMKNVDKAMQKVLPMEKMTILEICKNAFDMEKDPIKKAVLEQHMKQIENRTKSYETATERSLLKDIAKSEGKENAIAVAFEHMTDNFIDLLTEPYNSLQKGTIDNIVIKDFDEVTKMAVKIFNMKFSDFLKERIEEIKTSGGDLGVCASLEELLKAVRQRENERWKEKNKAKGQQDPNVNQAGQPKQAKKSPEGEKSPKVEKDPKVTNPSPTQSGMNQILGAKKTPQEEKLITRIEVDSNKGKVIVVFANQNKPNQEYLMRDMLYDRRAYRANIEKDIKEDILSDMTSKERKQILNSADIFVLKVLFEHDKRMLEAYLKNIDMVNGITMSTNEKQESIPMIMHNVRGIGGFLSKSEYKKALTEVNKDRDIESAEIEISEKTKIPKPFKEKISILGAIADWFAQRRQGKIDITTYEDRRIQEEEKAKKEEEKEKAKRERREAKKEDGKAVPWKKGLRYKVDETKAREDAEIEKQRRVDQIRKMLEENGKDVDIDDIMNSLSGGGRE